MARTESAVCLSLQPPRRSAKLPEDVSAGAWRWIGGACGKRGESRDGRLVAVTPLGVALGIQWGALD